MKIVKRWRYYCDFCKKSGGSKYHMEKHESICTANPGRKCGFCEIMEEVQPDISDLKKIIIKNIEVVTDTGLDGKDYSWNKFAGIEDTGGFFSDRKKKISKEENVLNKLREAVNNCPACILSAMRQTNTTFLFPSFDFKKEKKEMFDSCGPGYENYY
jgi:hypothetical protein